MTDPVGYILRQSTPLRSVATAITPDLVDGSSYGATYIAPDPFLHEYPDPQQGGPAEEDTNEPPNFRLDLEQGEQDPNGDGKLNTYRDPFKVWTDLWMPSNVTVPYVDDWFLYHLRSGEVHCSSNEERGIPQLDKWWAPAP